LRLRELQGRKPWILSRLTLQCTAEYLNQLLFALTGTDLPGQIAEIGVVSGMTILDIQSDYFLWIIGNQSADKDGSLRSFMAGLNDQDPEVSFPAEVILWYYLEHWKLPDDLKEGIVRETELLELLIELSGFYPVHVRFRLKEMVVQYPHVLSGLADRLSSPLLLNLIYNLSGVPAGELSGIEEIIPGYGTLRFSVREFRRAILHELIFENNPMKLIRSFIGKWTDNPESMAEFVSLQTEAVFWGQLESGTQVDFSMDQLSYLIRIAESYPGQTIFRLSHLVTFRPSLLSRLAARLDEAGLNRLIVVLIKSGHEWLENYQDILRENKIPVKPALWEVLRLAIIYPQTEVEYLNALVPVGTSVTEPGQEDQLWYYLEHGKFMESAGGAFDVSVGDYLLTMVEKAPLYTLSKLKEVARNNRSALNGFLIRQNTDFLERMVVALSGVDTLKLQTAVSPVPYPDLPDSLVRIFWLQALGWLIASPVSVRSDLINYIPVILDQLLPPITSATVSSAFRGYESEYIWKYLGAGILSDAEVTPGTDEINQVIQSYIAEKPTALLYRISALQRADRNFAARFTGNLSPDTLVFVAQKIFGIPDQLLTEMREKLQPDSASDSSWLESLRWIVSDLILRINVGKSIASARKKEGKLSDLALLWFFLEFGLFPAGMKPSDAYSPGKLLLQALADDPEPSRRQLAELLRTDDMLISRLSQILSVREMRQLIAALLGMGMSEWTSIENKLLPVDIRGDVRHHLWGVLQPLLSASADETKQIVASIRSQYSENPAVVYPDKPEIWFYLETGLLSGIQENLAGRNVASLLIDGVDADELWRRIRNTYQRNRLVLVRLTNLLNNYGIYQVVAHLTGDGATPWTELKALLEEYGNDEKSSGIILHLALQLLVTRGNRDRKMIVGWIREETGVAAPAIPGGESEPDEPASVWKWLESGRLDKGVSLPSDSDTASFVWMILLDHSGNMARLRELFKTRTGFWVRLMAIFGPEDQRNIIAAVLGLDVKAWDVLEEHIMAEAGMKSEDVLLASIRYILNSRSNSGEELLTGLFREAGLSSTSPEVVGKVRSEEYFWSYLEFGRSPVEGKVSRREGNQILEQGLRSIDGVFVRRLLSVFRRDNTMLLRLAIITSTEWRRKLLINILKTDISGLSHAEHMWSASFRKMTREDIVSAMLRLTFSGNADSPHGLIAALEKESGISAVNKTTASEASLEEPEEKPGIADSHPVETGIISSYEYLLWYFLEQGRYPPGVKAVANEAVVTQFMKLLNSDISGVTLRLRELYRFHPALLIHITNILSPSQLRQLVASIAGETEEEWMIQEDIIRSGTIAEHHTVRFQITALGFLLSGAAKDMKSLAGLMSARMGLGEPVDMVRSVEYAAGYSIWYYLEYGYHPPGTSPVSPDQVYSVLREIASKQATMVQERMRQIYRRTPAIIARINRVFDSSRLQGFISAVLNLDSADWKEARRLFDLSRAAVYPGIDDLYSFILKWWLTGEINDGETLIQVLRDLSPDPTRKSASMGSSSSRQSALWFYLEKGYYPADSVMLTDAELGDEILSAVSRDREDTLYRLRDLFRRNPVLLLLTSRLGNQAISSTIVKLIDISAEKLTQIVVSLQRTLDSGDSDNDLAYAYVWRMILSGEAENQSDLERLADRKEIRVNQADISPIYQVWYYLDQGKILAGSVSQNRMVMVLLDAAAAERAATVRQLRDLDSHSKGVFVRLLGLLSADNLKLLVRSLLDLGEENWQHLLQLPAIPDEGRILTDLLRGLLRGSLSDKSQVVDYLQQMPEYATSEVLSPVSVYESEMLMWYYLDSGKYPPGALPQSDEELGDMMMRAAIRESRETLLRLRELYKRRSGLLLTLSRILSEESRRKLVARLSELTDTEWSRIEDILQINTGQSPGKILSDTIRYLITGSGEVSQAMLSGLPGLIAQTTIADTQMSEEEYMWYFLEHGRLFDRHSPDVARLGEKIVSLWRVSPGRIAAKWKIVSSRTNIYNRLRQYYSRQILEQIIRARYEVVQIDPDLMIADLLTFSPPRGRKINTEQMWDFMIEILLPQLHIVKNSHAVFEELLDLLAAHYRIKPGKIARFLKDHPPVSQAGQKYALRASGTATSSEITMLTEMITAPTETFPAQTDFGGNIYITVLAAELQKVRELLSGALRWSDWPDAAGTIVWLLKTGRQPTLALIRKILRDEWVISNLDRSVPLETVEIIQEALASGLWHKILSVRDESIYYFDLLLQERLISHFNEVFFRVAAVTEPSVDKVAGLFLDRIIIQEGVTSRDLTGALQGKSSIGQGALFGYIRRKYARQGASVKPVLELVREASTRVDEAIFVSNAGLVILHPYLSRYFGMLGLLDGKEFRDEEAAIRAVHLLQYLATRQTETPEYLLVLNKILCGLPVDMPVTPGIVMTDQEVELSESLLKGVLQNWKRMENSTIDNLSGAFLVREGRLMERADRWTLHVKSRAYDILLEFMPWGFSRIKLSWMTKRMDVEWKTKA
jgi:hypothetical protein